MSAVVPIDPDVEEAVLRWRADPPSFVREIFQVEPDPWQAEALTALHTGHDRVSIRACHGPGKSAVDAWAIFHFMACFFPTRIPCTAPTGHQLNDILWAELAKWMQQMPPGFRKLYHLSNQKLEWVAAPKESFAVARTSRVDQPEALQGFHCDHLLFILDEATGIPEPVFEVAEGSLTWPGAKQLMTSNPTQSSGYFYDSHHSMRKQWYTMKVSSEDSPRVSDAYVEQMAQKYGRQSNVYRVRVEGEFPKASADQLIALELCEAAKVRNIKHSGEVVWGLDVARFGDDATALVKRRNHAVIEPSKAWHGLSTMQTCGRIVNEYDTTAEEDRPEDIYIDVIGIGSGVVDRLAEMNLPFSVHGVNVAEVASASDWYMRLRDELWFRMRDWFEDKGSSMPDDDDLIGELCTMRYHPPTSTGRLRVFSKDEMKKLGFDSPNRADALMMTFAHRFTNKPAHRKSGYVRRRDREPLRNGSFGGIM